MMKLIRNLLAINLLNVVIYQAVFNVKLVLVVLS